MDGQVQAEHAAQLRQPLRRDVPLEPDEVRHDVTGHGAHQEEDDEGDSEQRRHRQQATTPQVPEHEWRES